MFLHNLFSAGALRYYNANVVGQARSLNQAIEMAGTQFNSLTKQHQIKTELQSLSFADFVSKSNGNKLLGFRSMGRAL